MKLAERSVREAGPRGVAIACICFLGSLLTCSFAAQPPFESNESGLELAAKLRSLRPAENAEVRGAFKIQRPDHDTERIRLVMKVSAGDSSWETIYETAQSAGRPPERLIIRHFAEKPNEYFFGQGAAITNPAPVPRQMLDTPLAGSDFTFMDLGLEFLHWPTQHLLKPERPAMKMSRPCDLLESGTSSPAGSYSKVRSYVDKETGGLISAQAFDNGGKVAKEFSVRTFKKVQGRYELQEMRMINNKSNSRTLIDFELGNGK